ncbi:putative Multiple inositol polyphosphate phosphatase 1 precursor [Tripterygium wilfordii]|uniref:Multiple inositol polyphosphate phosphatase 1 n=1 Tax=Tripterygium wilfordii TaxID=458696 RepID=A0A7J7E240_TRIWF|nr:putative Multiple inositol polyphosphate phosphatase 1 precursor [Tripterygium wilfordii]
MKTAMAALLILFSLLTVSTHSMDDQSFDIRQHLSTVTRYGAGKDIADNSFVPSDIPDRCTPIHLNLVARHGTRSPTKKRIRELDNLATRLEVLIRDAEERKLSLQKVPTWLQRWKSPWKGKLKGGELISKGEEELYDLGIRTRERFPELFNEEYHPDVYAIRATQVPRASASAVAFGMGLLSERGTLGEKRHRAFAVTSESRASDIMLRFFDCCENYKVYRKRHEPAVDRLKEPVLDEITTALVRRYELNFTRQDTSSLWFLCKQEASLLDITDQACGLFSPSEIALLEWTDDLEFFILKGYGNSLNYRMGVPLLRDVVQSMEQAIMANEENHAPGSYEKARLRFAHAETVVPFTCLLGLFLEGSEFQQIQREEPLQLPPRPPQNRKWRGSIVAPFAGNNMLVLYSCPNNTSSKHFVQVLHNEHPIPMPGCGDADFCPFEVFKERIVAPHLEHDYNTVCSVKVEQPQQKSLTSKLILPFRRLFFSLGNDDTLSQNVEL